MFIQGSKQYNLKYIYIIITNGIRADLHSILCCVGLFFFIVYYSILY